MCSFISWSSRLRNEQIGAMILSSPHPAASSSYRIAPRLLVKRIIKATVITYPAVEAIIGGAGREIRDFEQTFAIGRVVGERAQSHPYLHASRRGREGFARQELGRAIRTRNTNSPNTINYFPRNILSFCFTSKYRSSPSSLFNLYPRPPNSRISFMYGHADTPTHTFA